MNIIETNLKFDKLFYNNKPLFIVLHHSAHGTANIYDIHAWHKKENGWSGIGYHFFVNKDSQIFRGRPENAVGSHCVNHNDHSLGICAQGNFANENMSFRQKESLISLCSYLCNKYMFDAIWGHKELNFTHCPGDHFPLDEIKNNLGGKNFKNTFTF